MTRPFQIHRPLNWSKFWYTMCPSLAPISRAHGRALRLQLEETLNALTSFSLKVPDGWDRSCTKHSVAVAKPANSSVSHWKFLPLSLSAESEESDLSLRISTPPTTDRERVALLIAIAWKEKLVKSAWGQTAITPGFPSPGLSPMSLPGMRAGNWSWPASWTWGKRPPPRLLLLRSDTSSRSLGTFSILHDSMGSKRGLKYHYWVSTSLKMPICPTRPNTRPTSDFSRGYGNALTKALCQLCPESLRETI